MPLCDFSAVHALKLSSCVARQSVDGWFLRPNGGGRLPAVRGFPSVKHERFPLPNGTPRRAISRDTPLENDKCVRPNLSIFRLYQQRWLQIVTLRHTVNGSSTHLSAVPCWASVSCATDEFSTGGANRGTSQGIPASCRTTGGDCREEV